MSNWKPEGGYPTNLVMFKDGILQPKQIITGIEDPTAICIKNDGSMLYAHDGMSSGAEGMLMDVIDEHHFILTSYDSRAGKYSILFNRNSSKNLIFLKAESANSEPATSKWPYRFRISASDRFQKSSLPVNTKPKLQR